MPFLLDTGVVYALADADDAWHARCRSFIAAARQPLLVPVTVLPEVAYLLKTRLGDRAELAFVQSLVSGALGIERLTPVDVERSGEVLLAYPRLGFVDATVVAIAERLRLPAIVTTDRRDFAPIRPRHRPAFELLP